MLKKNIDLIINCTPNEVYCIIEPTMLDYLARNDQLHSY